MARGGFMKTRFLRAQEDDYVALVVGKTVNNFERISHSCLLYRAPTASLLSILQSSYLLSYIPCLLTLCLRSECLSYL